MIILRIIYINLGDENHIRIVWSCSNAVKHTRSYIFHTILTIGLPVVKTLIKYNRNNRRNDEEEKETIDIELAEQNADPENEENAIDLRWLSVHEED